MRRALAVVGVHSVHTHATILAAVTWTVIDIVLAVRTCEAWQTKETEMAEAVFALVNIKTHHALAITRHLVSKR